MGRIITAIFMLFTLGCMPTVYIHTESPEDHSSEIRDAGRHLGVRTKVADAPGKGVISVEFRPPDENVCGQALEKLIDIESPRKVLTEGVIDCEPVAWSCPGSSMFLGHEIGHLLGLPHIELDEDEGDTEKARKWWGKDLNDDNLMRPAPKGTDVTKRQRLVVQGAAILMNEVCRGGAETVEEPTEAEESVEAEAEEPAETQ